ncbi:MAG: rRNA maturation RNase YbeY [Cyclobacteriaceae bacterium]
MAIHFFSEDVDFKLKSPLKFKKWIESVTKKEKRRVGDITYIFCSDTYLLGLNQQFLKHNTLTDIITFDFSKDRMVSGEIYISVDRVQENADKFEVDSQEELSRVMIHGVLHLCGYKDKSKPDKILMREKEDAYLSLWRRSFT